MKKLCVEARNGVYNIDIGKDLLKDAFNSIDGNYAVITDSNVYPLYKDKIDDDTPVIVIDAGEDSKNFTVLEDVLNKLLKLGLDRSDTLVAFGGGVVGDLTGFAASIYKRGINFIQIPTTLLAQVDSSVGGKTGVNLKGGKNMAGTFYQPKRVVIDTDALNTLDKRQYAAGMAEVIKYGYIASKTLYENLLNDNIKTEDMIFECCSIKADIVENDPFDKGERMKLNYGHTLGHAIETTAGYGKYLHGEAVALGMCLAAYLGERLNISPIGLCEQTKEINKKYNLPYKIDNSLLKHALLHIGSDKKAKHGVIHMILIDEIGHSVIEPVSSEDIQSILGELY